MTACTITDCTRTHKARGLCVIHYNRQLRTGTPQADTPIREYAIDTPGTCTVPGCVRPYSCKGLCNPHYQVAWRTGRVPEVGQ